MPRMPVCSTYIYKCVCVPYIHNLGVHGNFTDLTEWKWAYWKTRHRYNGFFNDEENGCRFEGQRKETWMYTRPAWLIAVGKVCWSFIQPELLNSSNTGIGCDQVLDGS